MNITQAQTAIAAGDTTIGIELGSTRIKAVLTGPDNLPLAFGEHAWENRLENGIWTYGLEEVWSGLQSSFAALSASVQTQYGAHLTTTGALGISGMMHGYLPFDAQGEPLAAFRTWRNTMTEQASAELTELLGFAVPQRWSVAHLYQALLNGESHVPAIRHLTTLAGYVHWQLTGRKVLGVGEASGMFPIDSATGTYDAAKLAAFAAHIARHNLPWTLPELLPEVLTAGEDAGTLTEAGARLLDPTGALRPGIPLCPPEGDAGTGMVATNSVAARTGNVSAGTSVFLMTVLEGPLSRVYPEIDIVSTPSGKPVAMVHCNNCTADLDAWVRLFSDLLELMGAPRDKNDLYRALYNAALTAAPDGGGMLAYNYLSGEHITGLEAGRPLFVRTPESQFTLPNFMRTLLFSALSSLKIGMDILFLREHIQLDRLLGHGGFFKTKLVGQKMMASAIGVPVSVMETAGEGGAWGVALLASYRLRKADCETLEDFLDARVFAQAAAETVEPDAGDVAGFAEFLERYRAGIGVEKAAVEWVR